MIALLQKKIVLKAYFCQAYFKNPFNIQRAKYRAQIASSVIRFIELSDLQSIQINPSFQIAPLRSKIISHIQRYGLQKNQTYEESLINDSKAPLNAAKKTVLSFFTDGVWIKKKMVSDERFSAQVKSMAQVQKTNLPILGLMQNKQKYCNTTTKKIFQSDFYSKLIFCPTHAVTPKIFRQLRDQTFFYLYTGHFGIGKSWSFVLYKYLSDLIYLYRHYYCDNQNIQGDNIDWQIPKLIYYSLDYIEQQQEQFKNLILSQCYQLLAKYPHYELQQINSNNQQRIQTFYGSIHVKIRLIYDHVSAFASLLRQIIDLQNKKLSQKNKVVKQNCIKQIAKLQTIFYAVQSWKDILKLQFMRVAYLSSVDIEKYLFRKLALNLNSKQGNIITITLNYNTLEFSNVNLLDLIELIIVHLKQTILQFIAKEKSFNQSQLKDLQNSAYRFTSQKQVDIYVQNILKQVKDNLQKNPLAQYLLLTSPLSISQNLRSDNLIQRIFNKSEKQQFQQDISSFVDNLYTQTVNMFKQKLDNFIDKDISDKSDKKLQQTNKKKKFLLKLLLEAKGNMKQQNQNPNSTKEPIRVRVKFPGLKFLKDQIDKFLGKKLFKYDSRSGYFVSKVSDKILADLLTAYYEDLLSVLDDSAAQILKLIDTQKARGCLLQSLIRDCLAKSNTYLIFDLLEDNTIQTKSLKMSGKLSYFNSIPTISSSKYQKYNFFSSFQEGLKSQIQTLALYNETLLFLPTQKPIKQVKMEQQKKLIIHENSKAIDFITVRQSNKVLQFIAYDVTISDNYQYIANKVIKFINQVINFKDKQIKYQINVNGNKRLFVSQLKYVILLPLKLKKSLNWEKIQEAHIKKLQKQSQSKQDMINKWNQIKIINCYQQFRDQKSQQKYCTGFTVQHKSQPKSFLLNSVHIVSMFDNLSFKLENRQQENQLCFRLFNRFKKEFVDQVKHKDAEKLRSQEKA